MWDIFITYVPEDKESVVLPLSAAFKNAGLSVEYEDFALDTGKMLEQTLEEGFNTSKCGVIVLSPNFFKTPWSPQELQELQVEDEDESEKMLFHVWHRLTVNEVQQYSPELAQEMVFSTSEGFKEIAHLIQSAFTEQQRPVYEFSYETVLVDTMGDIIHREQHIGTQHVEELGNGVVLEMVAIPGGNFVMGASESEEKQRPEELPRHTVTVGALYASKYLITQTQWEAIMSNNPSSFKGDTLPVETVSWHDAVEFCQRLATHTGRPYRLPTEAEWEYACRAGTSTPFYFGETITSALANYNGNATYANEPQGEFRNRTSKVGQFPPNNFGLYDMHGNVREWCADPWHKNYYDAPSKAIVWEEWGNSSLRVLRGGAWDFNCFSCRSSARNWRFPVFGSPNIGFRVVYTAATT